MKNLSFEALFDVPNPGKTKVKFNMNAGDVSKPALDILMNEEDESRWIGLNAWKSRQANNNLNKADYLLAFAQYHPYGPEYYIFGGMYRVRMKEPEVMDAEGYELELMDEYRDFRRRLIIKLSRPIGRAIYNKPFSSVLRDFKPEVFELAPSTKLGPFPGYNSIVLTHRQLQTIFRMEAPDWKKALSVVKGVYCITNRENGRIYIGSASGEGGGIWQRWSAYADVNDLTGGNKAFADFKKDNAGYIINNFTYAVLEVFDMKTKADVITRRERFWKHVFDSVKNGMNCNY